MAELTLVEAVNDALHVELERDPDVLVLGEDVGRAGVLHDELAESIRRDATDAMRAGIAAAEAEPSADPALVFEHAYVDPPTALRSDWEELKRILG